MVPHSGTLLQTQDLYLAAAHRPSPSAVNLGGRSVVGHQFITVNVHLCVQQHVCETARCAGLSAAAETWTYHYQRNCSEPPMSEVGGQG